MLTRLSYNLLKLEHHADLKNWEDELRKFPAANTALHLVLTKKSELNLNDKDVFPQVWIDVFYLATYFILFEKKPACISVVWLSYSPGHVDHSLTLAIEFTNFWKHWYRFTHASFHTV